jgi:tetraacyldisaccharide 4'-kinase
VYGAGVLLRNVAYDLRLLGSTTPPVPVVAVGNMTAGGTGKTPLVGWITHYLLSRGARPALISRGYGRTSRGVRVVSDGNGRVLGADEGGDEPVQLSHTFPGVPVIVAERRTEAADVALKRFHPDILVLDDAYQHRAIGRHLNILVVDASSDLTQEPMLPAGRRREQLSSLHRASLLVFTHVRIPPGTVPWEYRIRHWYDGEIVYSSRQIAALRSPSGEPAEMAVCRGKRCLLLSGIGKPQQFEHDVRELGIDVAGHLRYRDHYRYARRDIEAILTEAEHIGADVLITTEKDLTRLRTIPGALDDFAARVQVLAAVLAVRTFPAGLLEAHLDACIGRAA